MSHATSHGINKITARFELPEIPASFPETFPNTLTRDEKFALSTIENYLVNIEQYSTYPHPLTTITISPDDVDALGLHFKTYEVGLGEIKDGHWYTTTTPLDDHRIIYGLKQRFEYGYPWEETVYVDRAYDIFEQEGQFREIYKIDEAIESRTTYLDELYETLKNDGYKSRLEIPPRKQPKKDKSRHTKRLDPVISIGKNGEIHLSEGKHRFALCRALDIDFTVNVICRHTNWQEKRERVNGMSPIEIDPRDADHPDLQDVLI